MKIKETILVLLGYRRAEEHAYEVRTDLHSALVNLANRNQMPVEEVQEELLESGLVQQSEREVLLQRWQSLSPREQDVTALTCLGCTNRQIAARLQISPATVKAYVRQVLSKYNLHSKGELRMLISHWDFSNWGPKA